jgi:hypothetical protein
METAAGERAGPGIWAGPTTTTGVDHFAWREKNAFAIHGFKAANVAEFLQGH